MNRVSRLMRSCVMAGVFVLPLVVVEQAAQACGRCGRACCPSYQVVQKTVMVPTMVPQTRVVTGCEYTCEVRERPVTVYRCVPEVRQVRQVYTVMVPQTRVREHVYNVAVPMMEEVEQPYTVCVPYQEVRQGVRKVCRAVEVQETRTVCRDLGCWEQSTCYKQIAPLRWGCFGRLACGGCAPVVCCAQMVWVPNIVTEEVPVTVCKYETVDEPCEYTVTLYRTEQRTRRVKVCRYVTEQRRCQVQETVCVPQQRERLCNVTTYRTVAQQVTQRCTVMVPHQVQREVTVMVCQMVPKQVCCRVPVSCCK